ncbi:uncharacterized protein N7483_003316 [Penicillium malachiteum]|uniref:uncharacterized protein n=1 Tax=Penicillium malachiteum TaxID=1324776 RepID=UPI0025477078|nr:uncharacterized protein N7483_003316 [Penicillium malachiteum]KAJ5728808.1 hypothetical protein N7483_003316 [Penicillium malachiteum]
MSSKFQRSVLVTGGTTGLGYQCALAIARECPTYQIIIASRTDNGAAETINKLLGHGNVHFMRLDLSSLSQVRSFATDWEAKNLPPLYSLVCNAALQFPGAAEYTDDGFEKTFAVSHVGHALLFSLLRPYLASTARVVITASGTHDPAQKTGMPSAFYHSAAELAHPLPKYTHGNGRQHYTNTKLANVLYMYALHRRFVKINEKTGNHWTVNATCPGLMPGTGLIRNASKIEQFLWYKIAPCLIPLMRVLISSNIHTPRQSGEALMRLAVSSDVEGISGAYFEGRKEIKSSQDSYNEAKQEDLWKWTIEAVARDEEKLSFSLQDLL